MDSLDALVRTVGGESSADPRERQAVAAAILNRARVQGMSIPDIVNQKGQFESWSNPASRARMMAMTPDSPQYRAIRAAVEPIYNGTVNDPTNGATHFYAPAAQASLGRNAPKWDDGSGHNIGQSRFFNKGAPTAADSFDSLADVGTNASAATPANGTAKPYDFEDIADQSPKAAPTSTTASDKPTALMNDKLTAGVQPFLRSNDRAGAIKYFADNGQTPDIARLDAALKNGSGVVSGQPLPPISNDVRTNLGAGFNMGVRDVSEGTLGKLGAYIDDKVPLLNSIDNMAGMDSRAAVAQYGQDRETFDATTGTTIAGGLGRLGGNVLASAPLMAAGGGVIGAGARALGVSDGALSFLGGAAGRAVAANEATGAPAVAGNLLTRGASLATQGTQLGAESAALTSGRSDAPLMDQVANGAIAGSALGVASGVGGGVVKKLAGAVSPIMSPQLANIADLAMNKYGIDLRGSQISPNMLMRRWDAQRSNSLLSDVGAQNAAQKDQFTRAVGNTFGADSSDLTPSVMTAAKNKIGAVYNQVGARNTLDLNPENGSTFLDDITGAHTAANLGPQNTGRAQNLMDEVLSKVGPDGTMTGSDFKTLTSRGSMLDNATTSTDGEYRDFAKSVRDGLNTELEKAASPEDVAALQKANLQWKNMRTVEKAIGPDGQISPALLQSKVNTGFKNNKYSGAGDLGELGQIGQMILKAPSSSGTAENARAQQLFSIGNLATGAAVGTGLHFMGAAPGVDMALAGITAGRGAISAGGNALASRLYGTPAYASKLINSALNGNIGTTGNALTRNILPAAIIGSNNLVRPRAAANQR